MALTPLPPVRRILTGVNAEAVFPMTAENKFIGLFALGCRRDGAAYSEETLDLLSVLITMASISVDNATLFESLAKQNLQLSEVAKLKTQFVSTVSHELSTPLGTIAVAARELERSLDDTTGTAARHEDVRLIRGEIDRCKRVLQDMAGRTGELAGEAPTPQSLASLEREVLSQLSADERSRLDMSLPHTVMTRWPIGAVSRALANIVRNGIQASGSGERVSLSARCGADDQIILTVADRGVGMSAAVESRAGEPFFTTRAEGAGMGLGLFVTMSTIDQLGGTMHLASVEGEGTTITIALPADAAARVDA